MTLFGQCSIDGKGGVTVQKCLLVAELKLKMSLFEYLIFNFSSTTMWCFSTLTMDPWSKKYHSDF